MTQALNKHVCLVLSKQHFKALKALLWKHASVAIAAIRTNLHETMCFVFVFTVLSHFNEKCRSLLSKGLKDSNSRMKKIIATYFSSLIIQSLTMECFMLSASEVTEQKQWIERNACGIQLDNGLA